MSKTRIEGPRHLGILRYVTSTSSVTTQDERVRTNGLFSFDQMSSNPEQTDAGRPTWGCRAAGTNREGDVRAVFLQLVAGFQFGQRVVVAFPKS